MSEGPYIARWFLIGGATLAVIGLVFWWKLPVPMGFPPYLITALLALIYGVVCLMQGRGKGAKKP
jgi:hypothetical protein